MSLVEKTVPAASDFAEQMRVAEEAAGVPADSEVYAEYGVESPEPDDAGRIPTSRPEEPEVVAEAPVEEATPEPEVEVPDPLAELNKKVGQLANDNADLRRTNEELAQRLAQPEQAPQVPLGDIGWFDEFVESDPGQAAYWALTNQQPMLYDRAIRTWHDTDPVAAGRYERQVEQANLVRGIEQTLQPQIAGAQALANQADLERAMTNVAAKHDDYAEVMGAVTEESMKAMIANGFPTEILDQKLAGTTKDKEQVYETLYRWQKAEVAGQLVQAARETPARQTEEAREAKREAFVGSATTTTPDAVEESEAERQARVWADMSPGLSQGWTGRDTRQRLGR